jgi:hypothetical protein
MKTKIIFSLCLMSLWFICSCASGGRTAENKPSDSSVSGAEISNTAKTQASSFAPVFVYKDFNSSSNKYIPSGWMGDVRDLRFTDDYRTDSYAGMSCIRIDYHSLGSYHWSGIYWLYPANNWGEKNAGRNLSGAKALIFWARGETGTERISEFKIGGLSGDFPDTGEAHLRDVHLTKTWKQYRIELKDADISRIAGGFCFVVTRKDNPKGCVFYLDEIRYE